MVLVVGASPVIRDRYAECHQRNSEHVARTARNSNKLRPGDGIGLLATYAIIVILLPILPPGWAMSPPYHVIVADDDDGVRAFIARVVVRTYPAVTLSAVRDGLDALLLFDQRGADLLITNNDMPRLN